MDHPNEQMRGAVDISLNVSGCELRMSFTAMGLEAILSSRAVKFLMVTIGISLMAYSGYLIDRCYKGANRQMFNGDKNTSGSVDPDQQRETSSPPVGCHFRSNG